MWIYSKVSFNLFNVLFQLPNLIELNIGNNSISEVFFTALGLINYNLKWESLNVGYSIKNEKSFEMICKNFSKLPHLKTLDISMKKIRPFSKIFFQYIKNLPLLKNLYLNYEIWMNDFLNDFASSLKLTDSELLIHHTINEYIIPEGIQSFLYFADICINNSAKLIEDENEIATLDFSHVKSLKFDFSPSPDKENILLQFFEKFHQLNRLRFYIATNNTDDLLRTELILLLLKNNPIKELDFSLSFQSYCSCAEFVVAFLTSLAEYISSSTSFESLRLNIDNDYNIVVFIPFFSL